MLQSPSYSERAMSSSQDGFLSLVCYPQDDVSFRTLKEWKWKAVSVPSLKRKDKEVEWKALRHLQDEAGLVWKQEAQETWKLHYWSASSIESTSRCLRKSCDWGLGCVFFQHPGWGGRLQAASLWLLFIDKRFLWWLTLIRLRLTLFYVTSLSISLKPT